MTDTSYRPGSAGGAASATPSGQSPNSPRGPAGANSASAGTGGAPAAGTAPAGASSSLGSGLRNQAEQLRSEVGDALDRGRAGISESAYAARDSMAEDMEKLRQDMAKMTETLSRFAAEAGGEAGKTLRQVGQSVYAQVGTAASGALDAGSELAASAKEQAKTFASELESMARKQPLGALAGALLVGVIIGMMSRGRG
jgi:ElaB/YqjD/DUF883 family membrane-anchored ribosome-binding protein